MSVERAGVLRNDLSGRMHPRGGEVNERNVKASEPYLLDLGHREQPAAISRRQEW